MFVGKYSGQVQNSKATCFDGQASSLEPLGGLPVCFYIAVLHLSLHTIREMAGASSFLNGKASATHHCVFRAGEGSGKGRAQIPSLTHQL